MLTVPLGRTEVWTSVAAARPARTIAVTMNAWSARSGVALPPPLAVKSTPVITRPKAAPIPRGMFSTPGAIPACYGGAEPMMAVEKIVFVTGEDSNAS